MVQETFNKTDAELQLRINPNTKNKALYSISNAITDNQKTIIRKLKAKIKRGTKNNKNNDGSKSKVLSSDDLEKRLLAALDRQPDNANLLGKAIDFFIKVKSKTDTLEDDIDMEVLRKIGIIAKSGK